MAGETTVKASLERLQRALSGLETAVDARLEHESETTRASDEVRRLNTDRSKLAEELDRSQYRADTLEETNREVSRRLVSAMETIRAVLDRS
ncbi:DUF4164 domain-containing protein [Pararhizobium mangrovi]|uniref:DUF4164 family protein n=1 Tax=Pararhizobium mangrovi TaxID=2590452 RepID=A0A506U2V1_9HYPH|nr:DUF4164 domain-containing protein [Pararhizobium mangrovi]TPW27601.1 DUF4164 family protein [Pararhizobium mangrovi]